MRFSMILASVLLTSIAQAARVEVEINNMTCGICAEAITKELAETQKVNFLTVSYSEKKARFVDKDFVADPETKIKEKPLSDQEIRSAIKRAGFDAGKIVRKKL